MKPKNSIIYTRCKRLIDIMADQGFKKISWHDLAYYIKRYIGADPRTITKYRVCLVDFGFMEPIKGTLRNPIYNIIEMPRPYQMKLTELTKKR